MALAVGAFSALYWPTNHSWWVGALFAIGGAFVGTLLPLAMLQGYLPQAGGPDIDRNRDPRGFYLAYAIWTLILAGLAGMGANIIASIVCRG